MRLAEWLRWSRRSAAFDKLALRAGGIELIRYRNSMYSQSIGFGTVSRSVSLTVVGSDYLIMHAVSPSRVCGQNLEVRIGLGL